jgi:hypothetical protein
MDEVERRAIKSLRFDWAPTGDDVWRPPVAHVEALNANALATVLTAFDEAHRGRSALSVAIIGQHGAGKTHLLAAARDAVQKRGGYFFLVKLLNGQDFWQNIVQAIREGLFYPAASGANQLTEILRRLGDVLGLSPDTRTRITGDDKPTRSTLDQVAMALRRTASWGHNCRHTLRALILLGSPDPTAQEVAEAYLNSTGEGVPGERMEWGIHPDPKLPQQIVEDFSRIVSLTGASVIAVDQIDTLISQSTSPTGTPLDATGAHLIDRTAVVLMELRETMSRSVTVVSCQPHTWDGIRNSTVKSAVERFRDQAHLGVVPSTAVARALVAKRFTERFDEIGFTPPYPTWPVRPEAFDTAVLFTPRRLFERIDAHLESCLDKDEVVELATLEDVTHSGRHRRVEEPAVDFSGMDARFEKLCCEADLRAVLDQSSEDVWMPELLEAALKSWTIERGLDPDRVFLDPRPGRNPSLHARMLQVLDVAREDQIHWSFRAIAWKSPKAVQNRIERLQVIAGLDPDVPKRKAYLLRTTNWSTTTKKTAEMLAGFRAAGGVVIEDVQHEDLRVFAALARLRSDAAPELAAWLRERRPASRTALFREVFGEPDNEPEQPEPPSVTLPTNGFVWPDNDPDAGTSDAAPSPSREPQTDAIPVGTGADGVTTLDLPLMSLRKHTAIFAGSGSGKTVLIRRLIEECALQGVSSIVLDPNNDLARLGDAWPTPPPSWRDGDDGKASQYLADTDVVIWTPRRESGRPLSFQPLPDLASLLDDRDEFGQAIDSAVATLAPRARADGATAKAEQARAVLREALMAFARKGGGELPDFLRLLADLPAEAAKLTKAYSLAEEMSQTLTATMINDPLFGGVGTPVDPGVLLTPAAGRRARVSVISFVGLPTDQQRQSFVNQLQMALFAWIKRHPANDRPLGGLFVMDEAQTLAPSGAMTACTASTLALASQARKYGLGLVFATQAPKGIHNRIVGNSATQFFGFINSPAQVAAAKEMAAARSSAVLDISRLHAGEFYAVTEGTPFRKITAPMCLSHHPPSALTAEEVLARATVDLPGAEG